MIQINSIHIEEIGELSRLVFDIEDDNTEKHVWFEVEKEYAKYFNSERADAILIGILSYAMRKNSDIISKVPISEELLFQIREYLIPSIAKYDDNLYHIKIDASIISEKLECAGKVGTGISCGIDSLHVLTNFANSEYKGLNLTHLCINSVGSWSCYDSSNNEEAVRNDRYKKAQEIADKLGLKLIKSNSNLEKEIIQEHLYTHTYSSMFALHCLAKLFKTYYYGSSGYDFSAFNIVNTAFQGSGHYELLSLNCFSTDTLRVYSEGGAKTRLEKTATIVDNDIAKNYLHVCLHTPDNCGICAKCKRTLLTLDALGKLDEFKNVFDINHYKKFRYKYILYLIDEHYRKNDIMEAVYQKMKKNITLIDRIRYILHLIFSINQIENYNQTVIKILGIKLSLKKEEM